MAAEFDDIKPKFDNLFIGIAGLIGAGKSTLATELGKYVRSLTLEDLTTPVLFVLWSTMANMCTIRYEFLVSVLGDDLQTGLPTYFEPVGVRLCSHISNVNPAPARLDRLALHSLRDECRLSTQ